MILLLFATRRLLPLPEGIVIRPAVNTGLAISLWQITYSGMLPEILAGFRKKTYEAVYIIGTGSDGLEKPVIRC
jgi:hypothetical protein